MENIKRIVKILVQLAEYPDGISAGELAKACRIPWSMLKGDLEVISQTYPVYTDQDNSECEEDLFRPEVKWFPVQPFEPYLPVSLGVEERLVLLRALESVAESPERVKLQQKLMDTFGLAAEQEYRLIKGNMDPVLLIDSEVFPLLDLAINQRRQVTLSYNGRKADVDPLGIVFYSRLRHWYMVAREGEIVKTFNLKNLSNIRLTNRDFAYPKGFDVNEWMGLHWGMEYGEPMEVKVRFINRAQTFDKVKKDTAHRKSRLNLSEDGQTLLMEDTVIGFNEFVSWVLGFGSAAEVIEPPDLREAVKDRVKRALAVYGCR